MLLLQDLHENSSFSHHWTSGTEALSLGPRTRRVQQDGVSTAAPTQVPSISIKTKKRWPQQHRRRGSERALSRWNLPHVRQSFITCDKFPTSMCHKLASLITQRLFLLRLETWQGNKSTLHPGGGRWCVRRQTSERWSRGDAFLKTYLLHFSLTSISV